MKRNSFAIFGTITFFVSFLYFRLFATQLMSYQSDHASAIQYTKEYLLEYFLAFGGLAELFANFLQQFYVNPWLGSLALALLMVMMAFRIFTMSEERYSIGVFLVAVSAAYIVLIPEALPAVVALTVVIRTIEDQEEAQLPNWLWLFRGFAFPLLLWFTGGWAWIYVLVVIPWDLVKGRKITWVQPAFMLYAFILGFIAYRFIWPLSLGGVFIHNLPVYSTEGFIFLVTGILAIFYSFLVRRESKLLKILFAVASVTIALYTGFHVIGSTQARSESWRNLLQKGNYSTLIEKAEKKAPESRAQAIFLNYALAKENRLLDEMFSFEQNYGTDGLLPNPHGGITKRGAEEFLFLGEFFYEIGFIDKAHRIACDGLVFNDIAPGFTKLKIKCLLAEGYVESADKYLNLLEHTLMHKKWAKSYRKLINDSQAYNKEFADIKNYSPTKQKIISFDPAENLLSVLKHNAVNHLAFNYFCAYNLLEKEPIALADNVWVLKELEYNKLPKHYQEALMIYQLSDQSVKLDLHGLSVDSKLANRIYDFGSRFSTDKKPALANYQEDFSDLYILHWFFSQKSGDMQ